MQTPVPSRRTALGVALGVALAAAALLTGGCPGRAPAPPVPRAVIPADLTDIDDSTAETTVDAVITAIIAGRQDVVWDLLHEEQQRLWSKGMLDTRDFIRKNPNNERMATQYKVTLEEFNRLEPRDIWLRSQVGQEGVLRETRIVQAYREPQPPTDVTVDTETRGGLRMRWYMRPNAEGRWRLLRSQVMGADLK